MCKRAWVFIVHVDVNPPFLGVMFHTIYLVKAVLPSTHSKLYRWLRKSILSIPFDANHVKDGEIHCNTGNIQCDIEFAPSSKAAHHLKHRREWGHSVDLNFLHLLVSGYLMQKLLKEKDGGPDTFLWFWCMSGSGTWRLCIWW